jgi:hypothetical protein
VAGQSHVPLAEALPEGAATRAMVRGRISRSDRDIEILLIRVMRGT